MCPIDRKLTCTYGNHSSLKARGDLVSDEAGEIWYASSVLGALLLFGLAVFFFIFGALPYWFKLHKSLKEILGCKCYLPRESTLLR